MMNTSGEAADQIVKMYLQGFEVTARIAGCGAKNVGAIICAKLNDKNKTAGKTRLVNMLKSGKELKVFSIKQEKLKEFSQQAKQYGVLYSTLINKKNKSYDGIVDIMVRAEDAAKINRIVDRFKLAEFDEVAIRADIEKTKNEKESKSKGVITKTVKEKEKIQEETKPIKKEEQSLNPRLAKTEKSPLFEHSLETQENSDQGTKIYKKPSVRAKLKKAREEVLERDKSKEKSEKVIDSPIKKKSKDKKR